MIECLSETGQADYELGRALYMQRFSVLPHVFQELPVHRQNPWIEQAQEVIEKLDVLNHVVMHESNIDGG